MVVIPDQVSLPAECMGLSKDAFIFCSLLPVYNQQVGPNIGALGEGLVPGGQQIYITDQPVTTASEAQPARRADGWGGTAGKG